MSPSESEVVDYLRAEANRVSAQGDWPHAARARDRRNRARRAGVLAAVALLAVALSGWRIWSGTHHAVPPATRVDLPQITTSPTFSVNRPAVVVAHVKFGPATGRPDVAYARFGVAHYGTRTMPAVKGKINALASMDTGGDLVYVADGSSVSVLLRDAAGHVLATLPTDSGATTNREGSLVAWSDPATTDAVGSIHVMDSAGKPVARLGLAGDVQAVAGEVVYVQVRDANPARFVAWNIQTGQTRSYAGLVRDVDEATGLAIVNPPGATNPYNVCTSLVDLRPAVATTRWTSCEDFAPRAFSPSGTYLLGTYRNYQVGVARVSDGHVLLQIVQESGGAWTAAMNSQETAVTFSATDGPFKLNQLTRCTLEGQCQVVGQPYDMGGAADERGLVWNVSDK